MHPILVQDLARQRMASIDREVADRRLVATARSAGRGPSLRPEPSQFRRLELAVVRLRLAFRGSAA